MPGAFAVEPVPQSNQQFRLGAYMKAINDKCILPTKASTHAPGIS